MTQTETPTAEAGMTTGGELRLIAPAMTPAQTQRMAFNLRNSFDSAFVLENKDFALAVYAEAYAMASTAPRAPAAVPDEAEPLFFSKEGRNRLRSNLAAVDPFEVSALIGDIEKLEATLAAAPAAPPADGGTEDLNIAKTKLAVAIGRIGTAPSEEQQERLHDAFCLYTEAVTAALSARTPAGAASPSPTPSPESTLSPAQAAPIDGGLVPYLLRQWAWSKETFGPALRTKGIVKHITKELREIEAKPHDLSEWVDVIILAMDGFWRHGGKPEDLLPAMQAKQDKNFARSWPDWRTMGEDQAIEHDRSGEAALARHQAVDVPAERERIAWAILFHEEAGWLEPDQVRYRVQTDSEWAHRFTKTLGLADAILATRPTDPGGARGEDIVSVRLIPWEPGQQGVEIIMTAGLHILLPLSKDTSEWPEPPAASTASSDAGGATDA